MTVTEPSSGQRDQPGLRERGKARRRDAIIRAAYTLFAERGYDTTTVSDIAAAAEVSPRTVAMYFPSKQDIALSRFTAAADSLTADIRARGTESVTAVLARWLRDEHKRTDAGLKRLALRMFAANPELNALRTARMAAAIDEGAAAVAEETGLPADSPGPRMAAAAASAMLIEISDLMPGDERDAAVATLVAFLGAGIATLRQR
ncbi:MAG TPA: TetR/AcrR family transcriptional regulator [Trebonia sp.]|nr:TetR/AcrR family transcriptional regulator [Trebonia sp.]